MTGLRGIELLAGADEVERLYEHFVHRTWAFHAVAEDGGPDAWEHAVTGTGMDAGMVFPCRSLPLEGNYHPSGGGATPWPNDSARR